MALLRTGTRFPFWDEGFLGLLRRRHVLRSRRTKNLLGGVGKLNGSSRQSRMVEIHGNPYRTYRESEDRGFKIILGKSMWNSTWTFEKKGVLVRSASIMTSRGVSIAGAFKLGPLLWLALSRRVVATAGQTMAPFCRSFSTSVEVFLGHAQILWCYPLVMTNSLPWKDPPFFNGKTVGKWWIIWKDPPIFKNGKPSI